jgi:hypothetical protein
MITGVLSCPNPPLLLPGMTGHPVAEVEQLRAACLDAIAGLLADRPDEVVIIGGVGSAERDRDEPLSIVVGRSLLTEAMCAVPIVQFAIADDAPTTECASLGRQLRERPARTALLVMADGSARRSIKAPGYLDDRAAPFDQQLTAALKTADALALAELDGSLASELLVAGWAAWQVLAAAAAGTAFEAELLYGDDPFGVWYPVASWRRGAKPT